MKIILLKYLENSVFFIFYIRIIKKNTSKNGILIISTEINSDELLPDTEKAKIMQSQMLNIYQIKFLIKIFLLKYIM